MRRRLDPLLKAVLLPDLSDQFLDLNRSDRGFFDIHLVANSDLAKFGLRLLHEYILPTPPDALRNRHEIASCPAVSLYPSRRSVSSKQAHENLGWTLRQGNAPLQRP